MTDQHPISPPPEFVKQCMSEFNGSLTWPGELALHTAARAAQWGYDQRSKVNEAELQQARDEELEACLTEIIDGKGRLYIGPSGDRVRLAEDLRSARRPKPPILKEQAIEDLESLVAALDNLGMKFKVTNILRALEAVPDD